MKDMMITIHIEGAENALVVDMAKVQPVIKELERAGKVWRLGKTC
jgi:hypothetical protein